ncbi:MAG TPA: HK97-gp10 family putative phage morphogenesis protein [Thermomonas sp.]|nr:HK97-gp10 family putative phage morphogenesis protein [Thermomonas sp.]
MARETVRIEGLDAVLRRLKALGVEAQKAGGPVRAGVRAGAVVIQKEMQENVRRIVAAPNIGGGDESTGLLEKSIKPMRAKARRDGLKGETFIVTAAKRARYPIGDRNKTAIAVATVGKMLEYGTPKRQPMPWARPAFHAKKDEAVKKMVEVTLKGIKKIERKLGGR